LPDAGSWLRPAGITAGVSVAVPTGKTSNNLSYDPTTRQFNTVRTANVTTVHWRFALEYSTLYLTDRFASGVLPKEDPLRQWIPLIEFALDSPRGNARAAPSTQGSPMSAIRGRSPRNRAFLQPTVRREVSAQIFRCCSSWMISCRHYSASRSWRISELS